MSQSRTSMDSHRDSAFPSVLIVEGGAMRGVFTTGVLDGFLQARFNPFDLLIGVSSGATNIAAYLANMPRRNFTIYTNHSLQPEFISVKRFLSGGHLMDLDWLWEKTIAEMRLDLKMIFSHDNRFLVCLTDVRTGKAIYKQPDENDLEAVIKASSAMPLVYRHFPRIDGSPTADGGIADPLPVAKAIEMGARTIMVLRTRKRSYLKKEAWSNRVLLWKLKDYPALCDTIAARVRRYNEAVALIRNAPEDITIIEICVPEDFKAGRFTRNKQALIQGYQQGVKIAGQAIRAWQSAGGRVR